MQGTQVQFPEPTPHGSQPFAAPFQGVNLLQTSDENENQDENKGRHIALISLV